MSQQSDSGRPIGAKRKRRVYQACEPCRMRKAKCDRGSEDDPRPPPCARCKRESIQSQCTLASKRIRSRTERSESISHEQTTGREDGPATPVSSRTARSNVQGRDSFNSPRQRLNSSHPSTLDEGLSDEDHNTRRYASTSQRNLTDNVIHTLVSKPNDALALLFEAAGRQDPSALNSTRQSPDTSSKELEVEHQNQPLESSSRVAEHYTLNNIPTPHSTNASVTATVPSPSAETQEIWKRYRFVRQGWLTALEAIQYVDLFFHNLSPLSPILLDYYSLHSNHRALITDEPMLCTTILTISSRYHVMGGVGGRLRSDDIHRKFWLYWKTLFMRVMYAQDTGSNQKTRALGTIESFLLMTEWHARALHFPPDVDGWDCEMLDASDDEEHGGNQKEEKRPTEEIEGAARRSDRMSWMLLGCALTLSHELGVSDQRLQNREVSSEYFANEDDRRYAEFLESRRSRPRRLLYIYINQMASRLGWTSMIPRIISDSGEQNFGSQSEKQWYSIMTRWISLTRLTKTASDMLFSHATTKQLLRTGNYVTSLEHFRELLQDWYADYQGLPSEKRLLNMLFIEYQFTRTYINSLAVQAVVDRALKIHNPHSGPKEFRMTFVFENHSVDFPFIQDVVDGSRQILKAVLALNEEGVLKFCPVRIFSRIISASILLLKATGLGARSEEAQISLELIDKLIHALRSEPVDELHLANSYASLLETHAKAFRKILRVSRSRDNSARITNGGQAAQYPLQNSGTNFNQMIAETAEPFNGNEVGNDLGLWAGADGMGYGNFDDWMCLPLDAFDPGIMESNSSLGASGLDFFSI
ncbi:hypothetical protein L207DRAFT_556549 [Hyaloscypha variabilis F]|uniref:Zn(2)-C6 fungal-type domain-containing protein n=1 Tax=Hyaloscypha variabilis (strain UAMH 11265 / GT02V1 / F) TaxID=1149755 RepID=A0A2J6RC03_HYAVF|nr:hypothetical protein L207DRAFT_556549 [Hyaloscypha variabilis F]